MDGVRDTFIHDQYVARHQLPHQRFNRYWLNAGYSDVQATVRINSLPIEIEETRVLKDPEWILDGKAKVEMGSTLSIILRDDRNTHWAGVYVVMWINGDIVYSEALNRNHPRLNGYVWSDDRAFVFTGDKSSVLDEEHEVTSVRVTVYSIKGGDNGIDFIPMAWSYLFPDRPPLFSFFFELECVRPGENKPPSRDRLRAVQVSTRPKRKSTKKRKDSGFGPGFEDEKDHDGTLDSQEDRDIDAEVENYLRQIESAWGTEGDQ
ncbi:BQ2448_2167 [Microbotryum intermedium]|uniref:BQ2448_2167 protein n=1 Tax=Microbotryum intermedium TaxID=269621 RepID=A0A238F7L9_9BASI|nr:BQ2448_2167 [Microbotryum intermedium]